MHALAISDETIKIMRIEVLENNNLNPIDMKKISTKNLTLGFGEKKSHVRASPPYYVKE